MIKHILPVTLIAAAVLVASATRAGAQDANDALQARRYIDPLNGFSLRPPKGAERQRQSATAQLVSWLKRDAKSGAIAWSLRIRKVTYKLGEDEKFDLKEYSKEILRKLSTQEKFKVDDVTVTKLAGKEALDLAGTGAGALELWQSEMWVHANEGVFLVFSLAGPKDDARKLDKLFDTILSTVEITDPEEEAKKRRKFLKAGARLMLSLDEDRVKKAIRKEPQIRLLTYQGKKVGYMIQVEKMTYEGKHPAVQVESYALAKLPDLPLRISRSTMVATVGRSLEKWNDRLTLHTEKGRINVVEKGLQKGSVLLCDTTRNEEPLPTRKHTDVPTDWYLPKAMGMILPRLLDPADPNTYAFATYNSGDNRFDMRTMFVIGKRRIEVDGRKIEAYQLLDQTHWDKDPATLYVTEDGDLIRMESVDGFVMKAVDRRTLLKHYPDAKKTLDLME